MRMTPSEAALSLVLPRWTAAFREERVYYSTCSGNRVPFTIEQSAAIMSGAKVINLGSEMEATIMGNDVHIDGNTFALKRGIVAPEELVVADGRDSSHMDLQNILKELDLVTGISARRWRITVDEEGQADVSIAPSESYIATEIRDRPVTDYTSLAQWLRKYDVKATREQLIQVFGVTAKMLPAPQREWKGLWERLKASGWTWAPGKGDIDFYYIWPGATHEDYLTSRDAVYAWVAAGAGDGKNPLPIKDFSAPLTVHFHSADGTRTYDAQGILSVRQVLMLEPSGTRWFLNGVPLLPFNDVGIWRCCTHDNTVLHLYDRVHGSDYCIRETLAGALKVPRRPSGFVPFPTNSGNMFGDAPLTRVLDVVAAAPAVLDSSWLTCVNAGQLLINFDHAFAILDALEARYGRDPCVRAISALMATGQGPGWAHLVRHGIRPRTYVRRRYEYYIKAIKDLLNGTTECPTVSVTLAGHSFDLPCTKKWSELSAETQGPTLVEPLTGSARMAMSRPDFILEELRTDAIEITVKGLKRKRS